MAKTVHVKFSNGQKFTIEIEIGSTTVGELKAQLVDKANVPAAQQRLIYKGRVLKDDSTLESYGVEDDHTIHLVRGAAPAGQAAGGSAAAPAATRASAPSTTSAASAFSPGPLGGQGFGGLGVGGSGGLGGMRPPAGMGGMDFNRLQQQLMQDPAAVREMLDSPLMQGILNSPELMRSIFTNNPHMQEIMDRNPDVAHILNDPAMMRQTLEAARNPEIMREMMRNMDRAMSNIEATPEGFNMLRRMYENVQEPMMSAAQRQGAEGTANTADNPFASLFGGPGAGAQTPQTGVAAHPGGGVRAGEAAAGTAVPNTAPLPNPWNPGGAPAGGTAPAAGPTAGGAGAPSPAAGLGLGLGVTPTGLGGPALGPFAGMGGLEDMGGLALDPTQMQSMLQNPAMQQMMQQVLSNPEMMQQLIGANPALRGMVDANPQFREALQNPDFLRQMADPNTVQQMMQLQSLMSQLQGTLGGAARGQPGGQPGAGAAPDMNALLQLLGSPALGGAGMAAPPVPVGNPEEVYANQLAQLQDMGFYDREENIRALSASGGNVHAAVERLLSSG